MAGNVLPTIIPESVAVLVNTLVLAPVIITGAAGVGGAN